MSQSNEQRSPFIRFLDAFFHEENIKWMLGAGVCILLGSSLRLVTMHWNECTPVWKYLILLGYTAVVFPLGEVCYHRLGLRKTGTVLLGLTVFMIPLSFLALHWVRPHEDSVASIDLVHNFNLASLLLINLAWSAFAAHRIFRHFLRTVQPTFLVSYLILCVAGAVVPGLPVAWAPILSLGLWAVFAAGATKVNRHVFWLIEEHRWPRIFGFFPILLLAILFSADFAFGLANQLTLAWIGLLSTLVALPILLTADTVARVFEQRTGGLVRPIPWSISGPLMLGTTLAIAGVMLSATGFPASAIVVPTSAVAGLALTFVARRTRKSAFVWGMLFCVMVTYQTSPVFFKELVVQIRDQAALAVRESRLPYAFYGLTYAPLIVTFSLLASILRRRGAILFAQPMQIAACILSLILLGASFTHPTAILPVGLVMVPIFIGQAVLFRKRMFLAPAAMAFLAVAYGFPVFCERVLDWHVSTNVAWLVWTMAAGFLFVPGVFIDRWTRSLAETDLDPILLKASGHICQLFSLAATVIASFLIGVSQLNAMLPAAKLIGSSDYFSAGADFTFTALLSVALAGLLIGHAWRWLNSSLSEWALTFATFAALQLFIAWQGMLSDLVPSINLLLLTQWLLSYWLERQPHTRINRAFARPLDTVSVCGMTLLFGLFVWHCLIAHVGQSCLPWTTAVMVLAWGLDAARRFENRLVATMTWGTVFVFATAVTRTVCGTDLSIPSCMVIWAVTGIVLLTAQQFVSRKLGFNDETTIDQAALPLTPFHHGIKVWLSPLSLVLPCLFVTIACANLVWLDWPGRLAGVLALTGMAASHRCRQRLNTFGLFWPLLNDTLLAIVVMALVEPGKWIFELTNEDLKLCGLPLAAFAAFSIWCFEWKRIRAWADSSRTITIHQAVLFVLSISQLIYAVGLRQSETWGTTDLVWAAAAWFAIAGALLTNALRTERHVFVWFAQVALLCSVSYFHLAGIWDLTDPLFEYVWLLVGIAFWSIGSSLKTSTHFRILSRPLEQVGFWLPLLVVPLALWRHVGEPTPAWIPGHILPMLGAATFYFWRGLETRHVRTMILSALILNLSTAMVWRDLQWTDPQLFLIPIGISILALTELLNREIPARFHERLRLSGALIILVSPTFQIVSGDWLHILTLMIASVLIALIAIGLRVRILLYTSTAFLLADLVALVARGSIDHPNLLWIVGVGIGAAVLTLGAICENHRENVLAHLRGLAAELELWH